MNQFSIGRRVKLTFETKLRKYFALFINAFISNLSAMQQWVLGAFSVRGKLTGMYFVIRESSLASYILCWDLKSCFVRVYQRRNSVSSNFAHETTH